MIAASESGREVPARARGLAGRLSVLFERDVEIVERLNDAHRRLRCANERLWGPDARGLIDNGVGTAPAGGSRIVGLGGRAGLASGPDPQAAVLGALQEIHWAIHRGLCAYQSASEERRQLAFEVGELSQQLTDVLCASGWSAEEARAANVHELAGAAIR
jgi:hypothetical protein